MRILLTILVLLLAAPASARTVVASIEPLALLAREVLGERATVETLLRPGQTPHFAAFTPSQARALREADLVLWLGAEAEPHLADLLRRSGAPALAVLDLDGVRRLVGGHDHAHDADNDQPGAGDRHAHAAAAHDHDHAPASADHPDPHLWLSPRNMGLLARALAAEFNLGEAALAAFEQRLAATVAEVRATLAPVADRAWLSYHDPWRYLTEAVGLTPPLVISESLQSDTSSRHFATLVTEMEARRVRCAIAEPEARLALMRRLCRGDCRLEPLDPLGRAGETAGYTGFLRHLGERFAACLAH